MPDAPLLDKLAFRPATAAKLLDVSERTVWRMIDRGRLRAVKDEGRTMIRKVDMEAYLASLPERRAA